MQRLFVMLALSFGLGLSTVGGSVPALSLSLKAGAHLSCGRHARTYRVSGHTPSEVGIGIECVIATGATGAGRRSIPTIVWYTQGRWQADAGPHRNLGVAFSGGRSTDLTGYASDIHGNGEDPYNTFPFTLTLHASQGKWPAPSVIDLTENWDERWTLVPDVAFTALGAPKQCGRYYEQYNVTTAQHSGHGLRCVFRIGKVIEMWLGTGTLDGKSYTQLGFLSPRGYAVSDLCDPGFGARCQAVAPGLVTLKESMQRKLQQKQSHTITMTYKTARGSWIETWQSTS